MRFWENSSLYLFFFHVTSQNSVRLMVTLGALLDKNFRPSWSTFMSEKAQQWLKASVCTEAVRPHNTAGTGYFRWCCRTMHRRWRVSSAGMQQSTPSPSGHTAAAAHLLRALSAIDGKVGLQPGRQQKTGLFFAAKRDLCWQTPDHSHCASLQVQV